MHLPPAVRLIGVTKRIGRKTIVEGLDFAVEPGEVFGLLGPNGAGKTTTIRLITGLAAPTEGEILIHGRSIRTEFKGAASRIGAVVETPGIYGFLTGYEHLLHYLYLTEGIGRNRLEEVVAFFGLRDYIHDRASTYSLGMRQRLGIAQAVLHRPSVLILDEPTNGLDPAGIKELREHLRGLARREGVAVIVASHILAEMEMMCDRTAVLKRGRLLEIVSLSEAVPGGVRFAVDDVETAQRVVVEGFPGHAVKRLGDALEVAVDQATTAGINAALVHAGLRVYAIQPAGKTLEEIFMALTGEDGHD